MNKERMLQLAEYIESLPEHKFDMTYWISSKVKVENDNGTYWERDRFPSIYGLDTDLFEPLDCGTACCIAGWATAMENNFKPIAMRVDGKTIEQRAQEWLGLTEYQAKNLFLLGIDTVWTHYVDILNYNFDEYEEQFEDITNKDAAFVIREIVNGNVDIDQYFHHSIMHNIMFEKGYFESEWDD